MKTTVFQPFQKVWTPRTPDSNYDSLGPLPSQPIVNAPVISEGIGIGIGPSGIYTLAVPESRAAAGVGYGITLVAASYTVAP